jgi:hypothetical protein
MAGGASRTKLLRVAIVGGGVLVAANVFVFAGLGNDEGGDPVVPTQIERLYPNPGEVIRPQETVGADLRNEFQGELSVNGIDIPRDQLSGDPNLGMVTFRPGCEGSQNTAEGAECVVREFDPGSYTAQVEFWPRTKTAEEARADGQYGSHRWQFKVG